MDPATLALYWYVVAISLPKMDNATIVDGPMATYEACRLTIQGRFATEPGRIGAVPQVTMYGCLGSSHRNIAIGASTK